MAVLIPIASDEVDLFRALDSRRMLTRINRMLKNDSIPVGKHHQKLKESLEYDCDNGKDNTQIAFIANQYNHEVVRYNARVTSVVKHGDTFKAYVDWDEDLDEPESLSVQAVIKSHRIIKLIQFGVIH